MGKDGSQGKLGAGVLLEVPPSLTALQMLGKAVGSSGAQHGRQRPEPWRPAPLSLHWPGRKEREGGEARWWPAVGAHP